MSIEITQYSHPPIPTHLAHVRRLGLSMARWASRAAIRREHRLRAESERVRASWELREEFARQERRREQVKSDWYLRHVW